MNTEEKLKVLKRLIDEYNYPYYEDSYLIEVLESNVDIISLAIEFNLQKAALPEMKLGDVEINPPSEYFYRLANCLRNKVWDEEKGKLVIKSQKRVVTRYDGRF